MSASDYILETFSNKIPPLVFLTHVNRNAANQITVLLLRRLLLHPFPQTFLYDPS